MKESRGCRGKEWIPDAAASFDAQIQAEKMRSGSPL